MYTIYILALILCVLNYILIIKPWKALWKIKQKHGDEVYIYFYPFNGAYRTPYSRR